MGLIYNSTRTKARSDICVLRKNRVYSAYPNYVFVELSITRTINRICYYYAKQQKIYSVNIYCHVLISRWDLRIPVDLTYGRELSVILGEQ